MTGVYVNESYSTKICHICHHETKGGIKFWKEVEKVDGSRIKVKATIYGLRRCTNNECRITWDRDHNARINIYICLRSEILNGVRPEYLCVKRVKKISPKKTKKIPLIKKKTSIIKKPVEETFQLASSDTMYPC